jgi:hypothetical protein
MPTFYWRDWGKPRKISINIAGRWGRDFNPGPLEYEAGVLTTRPRRLVYLCGGTEVNHEKSQSGYAVSGPRFEPGTSKIRNRSVNHSTTTFGTILAWHLKPYLCNSGSNSWAHCLITVTMVTMETKVRSLSHLNNTASKILLNNVKMNAN